MQRREKILAAVLAAGVFIWWGLPFLGGILFGPITERKAQLKALAPVLESLDKREDKMLATRRKLALWRDASLPPDTYQAQRLYQEWLTDLAFLSGWTQLKVTPDQIPTANAAYKSVRVTVKGEGTFKQVVSFLFNFRRVALLHRIQALKLESQPSGDRLKITLAAEGLCLADAPPRTRLFPRGILTDSLPRSFDTFKLSTIEGFPKEPGFEARIENEFVTVKKMNDTQWTVKRGVDGTQAARHPDKAPVELFPIRPDRAGQKLEDFEKSLASHPFTVPPPTNIRRADDPNDPARNTKLVGSFLAEDDRYASLVNKQTNVKTVVRKGDSINIGDIDGTVAAIEPNAIQIRRGNETWELPLGKDLRSMTRVSGSNDDAGDDDMLFDGPGPGGGGFPGGAVPGGAMPGRPGGGQFDGNFRGGFPGRGGGRFGGFGGRGEGRGERRGGRDRDRPRGGFNPDDAP